MTLLAITILFILFIFIGIPIAYSIAISALLGIAFIWSILLGAAVMTRKKRHFSFSFLKNKIESEQYKCILSLIQNGIILCFSIICLVYSAEITSSFWNSKWVTIPAFRQGYVWLILPITFSSIILFLLEDCFEQMSLLIRKKQ